MSQVWKRVRKVSGKYTPTPQPVLRVNEETIADGTEVANTIVEKFADITSDPPCVPLLYGVSWKMRRVMDWTSRS